MCPKSGVTHVLIKTLSTWLGQPFIRTLDSVYLILTVKSCRTQDKRDSLVTKSCSKKIKISK